MTTDPLISAALLGSSRLATLPPAPDATLEQAWQAIPREDPAASLLSALALYRALRLAGVKAREAGPQEEPAPAETREVMSPPATACLVRLLAGEFSELLPEGLRLASASGLILPARVLPDLLKRGTAEPGLRSAAAALAGERGAWIARRHPDFQWLLAETTVPDHAWDEEQPAMRLAWLEQTRATDPERAMAAITSQWGGESPAMREGIVKVIAAAPLAAEEEWLETVALKDRRQEVREQAISALGRLDGSAFRTRARERLRACISVTRKLLRKTITITPPAAFSPEWTGDGLKEKAPQGTGEKAWWLRQIIAAVPVTDWKDLTGMEENAIFSAISGSDWEDAVILGWVDSARRVPSLSLPCFLIPFLARLKVWPRASGTAQGTTLAMLLRHLPLEESYPILDTISRDLSPGTALEVLASTGSPPPPGLGRKILALLQQCITAIPVESIWQPRALAVCVPPGEIRHWLETFSRLPQLTAIAENFAATLEFRRSLYQYFHHSSES